MKSAYLSLVGVCVAATVFAQVQPGGNRVDSIYSPEWNLLYEATSSNGSQPSVQQEYVWLGDRPVAQFDGEHLRYTATSHLNAPILQTDQTDSVVWRGEYEPYGAMRLRVGEALRQPLRLPGQEASGDSNEREYNVQRWYRPFWGRYSQADPIGIVRTGEIVNLYQYANEDPIVVYDPSGLDAVTGDVRIQKCMLCIFDKGGMGQSNSEEAFWIICKPGGGYDCELWPSTMIQGTSAFSTTNVPGPVPQNACGFMHTHPRRKPGPPSGCANCDQDLANRLGKPLYTVHPSGIWKYDPSTGKTTREADYKWEDSARKNCGPGNPCHGL